jgi:flavin-dependent dehydrogenase
MEVASELPEVLVVGGGPGGCAAAMAAAATGVRVTLLERDRKPRERPGETLHPGVEPLLERLGATVALYDAAVIRHSGHWVRAGGQRRFQAFGSDTDGPWRGFQVQRDVLDRGLRHHARAQGVHVRAPARVTGVTRDPTGQVIGAVVNTKERIAAHVVIDAAGATHLLSRTLGVGVRQLSPRYVATYGYATADSVPSSNGCVEEAELIADPQGWTWIARVGPQRWHWTRLSFHGRRMPRSWTPPEIASLAPMGPSHGAEMTWRMAEQVAGPGWLLVGDAAATLDPASSHGVLRALLSGLMAGRAAAIACGSPGRSRDAFAKYDAWFRSGVMRDVETLRAAYAEWTGEGGC